LLGLVLSIIGIIIIVYLSIQVIIEVIERKTYTITQNKVPPNTIEIDPIELMS